MWSDGLFAIAQMDGPAFVQRGKIHSAGVGVWDRGDGNYTLIHIGSGYTIVRLIGVDPMSAMVICTDIAEAGDWSFEGLMGWANMDPQLGSKIQTIVELYSPCVVPGEADPIDNGHRQAMIESVKSANSKRLN